MIVGANSGFCAIDLDTVRFRRIVDPEPGKPKNRLNDGKIDLQACIKGTRIGSITGLLTKIDG